MFPLERANDVRGKLLFVLTVKLNKQRGRVKKKLRVFGVEIDRTLKALGFKF
jgi:hypothetical protein